METQKIVDLVINNFLEMLITLFIERNLSELVLCINSFLYLENKLNH